MKLRGIFLIVILFAAGCATFKELTPKPEIVFEENGYLQIRDDDENFELEPGKKYFVKFPPPLSGNIYLVLSVENESSLTTYLTDRFDDGEDVGRQYPNLNPDASGPDVYAIEPGVQSYFWVIENVAGEMKLGMTYRYIAAWRYKFENRYEEFLNVLRENSHDRTIYEGIGSSILAKDIDYEGELAALHAKYQQLETIHGQLNEIKDILPAHILDSDDASYRDYVKLKNDLENEMAFQNDYRSTLELLDASLKAERNMSAFVDNLSQYVQYFDQSAAYPANVLAETKKQVGNRLDDIYEYYDALIKNKTDVTPIDYDAGNLGKLFAACDKSVPADVKKLESFISKYNERANQLIDARSGLAEIKSSVSKAGKWPGNSFYTGILSKLAKLQYRIPRAGTRDFEEYRGTTCVKNLNAEINKLKRDANRRAGQYRRAEALVPSINTLKEQNGYRDIIRLLRENTDLSFLIAQYPDIDKRSLNQQTKSIDAAMRRSNWAAAEKGLRDLFNDKYFFNLKKITKTKIKLVAAYEDTMANRITRSTLGNARKFISENLTTTGDMDAVYANPALQPVYEMTFSSRGKSILAKHKQKLFGKLDQLRYIEFPEKAIKKLYSALTADVTDNGVARARAIVGHGKYYKGSDKKIKKIIGECDPTASKWLTKPKTYRKIFALPITSNLQGENEYMFKINLRLPSEARFPVFDVNIRLPKEIAEDAGNRRWYEKMMMNKKLLKNEGRFTITAPTAANGYECQITPLQVVKDGDSVLEVRFKHKSFKVFEISVMAQRPIMKKN